MGGLSTSISHSAGWIMRQTLHGVLPTWVEPNPLRSRATDALGLQAVADQLADRLLPGLSVATTRARYFTFLAWARDMDGRDYRERNIHRYEVRLALMEASLSLRDPDWLPRVEIQPATKGQTESVPEKTLFLRIDRPSAERSAVFFGRRVSLQSPFCRATSFCVRPPFPNQEKL